MAPSTKKIDIESDNEYDNERDAAKDRNNNKGVKGKEAEKEKEKEGNKSKGVSFVRRHKDYYIDAADLHILAGTTLFRVHSYFFARDSPIFHRKLHPTAPGDAREGTTDKEPLVVEDVTAEEFEKLCWVFYNPRYSLYDAPVSTWLSLLSLADKWDFARIIELVVRQLAQAPASELSTAMKLALYQRHRVPVEHIVPLYAELCARDTGLSVWESKVLGVEGSVVIWRGREMLRAGGRGGEPLKTPVSATWTDGPPRSPLPEGVEAEDVYRAVEMQLGELGMVKGDTGESLRSARPGGWERDDEYEYTEETKKKGKRDGDGEWLDVKFSYEKQGDAMKLKNSQSGHSNRGGIRRMG